MVVVVWECQCYVGDMQVVVVGHWAAGRGWGGLCSSILLSMSTVNPKSEIMA